MPSFHERHLRARSFQTGAKDYDRARPSYPDEAIDLVIPNGAKRVLDLGAGTGILTESLAKRVDEVVAVDPSEDMLECLAKRVPSAEIIHGTAEYIPLPDDDVDAVTVGTAWHWMDPVTACAEIARVLKPGGTLSMLWNSEANVPGWHEVIAEIQPSTTCTGGGVIAYAQLPVEPFGSIERHFIEWVRKISPQKLLQLYQTHSIFKVMSESQQAIRLQQLKGVIETHPELQVDEVDLHMVTEVWVTHLQG